MKVAGGILIGIGLLVAVIAFGFDTTTKNYLTSDEIYNIGLLTKRIIVFSAGCFILITGTILFCVGIIFEKMQEKTETIVDVILHNEKYLDLNKELPCSNSRCNYKLKVSLTSLKNERIYCPVCFSWTEIKAEKQPEIPIES